MKEKFITIFKAIILLGTIGVALNILFGANTMIFVERQLIPGTTLTWYKFYVAEYYNQLETSITDTTTLQLDLPRWGWVEITNWESLGHDLAVLVNYVILIINVLLYPLKIGGYMMRFVLGILGLNYNDQDSGVYWLGTMANRLMEVSIPYIGGSIE